MRHILHEILARYLANDQYAFETTSRELWPESHFPPQPQAGGNGSGLAERGAGKRINREPESQN